MLPAGFGYEWTGTVFQQRRSEATGAIHLRPRGSCCVLLFLAALYESWSHPVRRRAGRAARPARRAGCGRCCAATPYDLYTQIGIVTLIGLAAKNAILIVEYAQAAARAGDCRVIDAAEEAAQLRFRPILMTSFAFLLGVLPLRLANGAGAASRRALGTTVFGGMVAATFLAVFLVPVLYVLIQRLADRRRNRRRGRERRQATAAADGAAMKRFVIRGLAVAHGGVHDWARTIAGRSVAMPASAP